MAERILRLTEEDISLAVEMWLPSKGIKGAFRTRWDIMVETPVQIPAEDVKVTSIVLELIEKL